jgi:hypothetical protein
LEGAALSFHWKFEEYSDRKTRITQHFTLTGPNASNFIDQVRVFEQSAPEGMKKLAASIENAARKSQ